MTTEKEFLTGIKLMGTKTLLQEFSREFWKDEKAEVFSIDVKPENNSLEITTKNAGKDKVVSIYTEKDKDFSKISPIIKLIAGDSQLTVGQRRGKKAVAVKGDMHQFISI